MNFSERLRGRIRGVATTPSVRPAPLGFWQYVGRNELKNARWIPAALALGTTPTTREKVAIDFRNFHHPVAATANFSGTAAWIEGDEKLYVVDDGRSQPAELYDLKADPLETADLAAARPARVTAMLKNLHAWQVSVERSLTGADYPAKSVAP